MEYTVQKLANLAGISSRTLRYYDKVEILKPARINSSGYRIYGQKEIDQLQQILFYKELGVSLEGIKDIITAHDFDRKAALIEHRENLLAKRVQLDRLLSNVDKTIAETEGGITMKDQERFDGFKQELISNNEKKYGKEIREKYGDKQIDQSNKVIRGLTKQQYNELKKLGADIIIKLKEAFSTGDPAGELGQQVAKLHKEWLGYSWPSYTKEAHAGLAQMYVDDERFTAYYDKDQPGLAAFLRDTIFIYTETK